MTATKVNAVFHVLLPAALLTAAVASAQTPVPTPPAAAAAPQAPSGSTAPQAPSGSTAPQAPSGATAPQVPPAAAAAKPAESESVESPAYTYDPQGRRDPFISLLRRGTEAERSRMVRAAGIAGLEAAEVVLKGTMQSPNGYVALVEATDRKTYIVKTGDRLLDGTVRTITADTMVILQQVNDPLSLEKQREVRKMLRQTDEVK